MFIFIIAKVRAPVVLVIFKVSRTNHLFSVDKVAMGFSVRKLKMKGCHCSFTTEGSTSVVLVNERVY